MGCLGSRSLLVLKIPASLPPNFYQGDPMNSKFRLVPILALTALPLACGMAFAQSSVTVSGTIDIGAYRGFDTTKNVGPISRSNLAFSGSEDLGDGLAAIFRLSTRFEPDTGTTECCGKPFWQGESTVGLKGGFGKVRLGRALDPIWGNDWAFDPWGNFDRIASPAWQYWHYNYATSRTSNGGAAEYGRTSNGIFYDSPSWSGVSAHVSGSFEKETVAGAGQGNSYSASLNYAAGSISAMLAHGRNANGDDDTFVGAKYDFGAFALMGAYDKSDFKGTTSTSDAKAFTLGATYAIGLTTLKAGYGRLDNSGQKSSFIGLGAQYDLSKRTNVYADYGNNRPSGASNTHAYGVGINHSF
jgi:predicted porin